MVRDGQQTSERILSTAHRLFMERGYVGVSINDVVQAVGITKPTLYYHYADKEALYTAVATRALELMGEELRAVIVRTDLNFEDQVIKLIEVIQGHGDEDFRMMRHQIRTFLAVHRQSSLADVFHAQMVRPIVALMEHGQRLGSIQAGSAFEIAMVFLCHVEAYTGPEAQVMRLPMDARRIAHLFLYGINHPRAVTTVPG